MRTVTEAKLGHVLTGLPGLPRVVTSGNFATPWRALSVLDATLPQLNPRMPYTFGDGVLATNEIDYAIEVDEPLPVPVHRAVTSVSRAIGEHVAALIPDHATLQMGIGLVPDVVLGALASRTGLSVWSEMFSDGVLALEKAGALDAISRSPRRLRSAVTSSTTGSTTILGSGCSAPRRPTIPA